MSRTMILGSGMQWHPLPGGDEPAGTLTMSPYMNVEDNIRRLKAAFERMKTARDWRSRMHPDDRAWLERIEAPLRAWGWSPPSLSFMDEYGDPDLIDKQWR